MIWGQEPGGGGLGWSLLGGRRGEGVKGTVSWVEGVKGAVSCVDRSLGMNGLNSQKGPNSLGGFLLGGLLGGGRWGRLPGSRPKK